MPIIEALMNKLTAKYGQTEGEHVYYALEAEGKGPFGPNGKYRQLHLDFAERNGVTPLTPARRTRARRRR